MASKEIQAKIEEQHQLLQQKAVKDAPESSQKKLEEAKEVETKKEHTVTTTTTTVNPQNTIDDANKLRIILKGVNDIYTHHFDFKEMGVEFDIEIKTPNALEEAPIKNFVWSLFPDVTGGIPDYQYIVYYTMKLLELYGRNLPAILQDPENIYNTDILYVIGEDFLNWKDQFQL
jgi:hypothetical protein